MTTYKQAGVDVKLADTFVERLTPLVESTHKFWVGEKKDGSIMNEAGGFAAVVIAPDIKAIGVSTDGVGTKAWIAYALDSLDTIGEDLVAMNVNDLWVTMEPDRAFLVDYYATKKLYLQDAMKVIKGIVQGCKLASTALVAGETAELPLKASENEVELAATIVGVTHTEQAVMRPYWTIRPGMGIFGYPSRGVHSNGFSLVHKAFGIDYAEPHKALQTLHRHYDELGRSLGEELLRPTPIWQEKISRTRKAYPSIAGFAHITGGGLVRNIPRILSPHKPTCGAVIRLGSWPKQPIFKLIQKIGDVDEQEMLRTFNCGIGLVAITREDLTPAGFYHIGDVVSGDRKVTFVR